jgi:bifunctional non-homologous end joining protein LigD
MSLVIIEEGKPSVEDITNSTDERQLWQNVSTRDIMHYYASVGKFILPHIKDRVQSLRRDEFAKDGGPLETITNMRGPWTNWVQTQPIYSASSDETKPYIIANDVETILYLNTIGAIELNPWLSQFQSIEKPNALVIDLDPGSENTFDDVIECALVVKSILDMAGVKSYVKTSGGTGLHIYVGTNGLYEYAEVRNVAQKIAEKVIDKIPGITTIERKLSLRPRNKIYVDFMQNKRGATLAAIYGVRPRKEPFVSMPMYWDEVKKGLHPSQFTIHNALKRVNAVGDIFYPVLSDKTDLKTLLSKII